MAAKTKRKHYWGVDCGSSEIKVVSCDQSGKIISKTKQKTLFPLIEHVKRALSDSPFESDDLTVRNGHVITVTGYGRNHLNFASHRLTEIKAHHIGVRHQTDVSGTFTIIDIGGQDSKVIQADDDEIRSFVMNRKCAAGTGAYIEELAHRLEISLEAMSGLQKKHDKDLVLNSYCTVFAGQEVIKILMQGEKVENLIHALYMSVVKRVLEMTVISSDKVVFSGGVMNYHPALLKIFRKQLPGKKIILAKDAQYCGAIGAALYGLMHGDSV
ncbi:MAG: acyl-CoA dehydratase activase [Bdellovibrionota bacterium]